MHLKISHAKWGPFYPGGDELTHWGRVTHICVVKLTIIGSDNGLSPGRRQAIIWTNAGILLIGPLGKNFIEILIGIQIFSFKKMHFKISSGKCRPSCLELNVLTRQMYKPVEPDFPVWISMFVILIVACLFMYGRCDPARPLIYSSERDLNLHLLRTIYSK